MRKFIIWILIFSFVFLNSGNLFAQEQEDIRLIQEKIANIIIQEAGEKDIGSIINNAVSSEWRIISINGVIMEAIERATERVLRDTSFTNQVLAGYFPNKARAVAKKIIEKTLKDKEFKEKINELFIRVYTRILEEITMDIYIQILAEPGKILKKNYGKDIAKKYVGYIGNLVERADFSILERVCKEDLQNNVYIKYNLAKWGFLGGIASIATLKIFQYVREKVAGQIESRVFKQLYKRIIGQIIERIEARVLLKFSTIIAITSLVWDLAHAPDNIRKVGKTIENMEEFYDAIEKAVKNAGREYSKDFIIKAAEKVGWVVGELYIDFKEKEGIE